MLSSIQIGLAPVTWWRIVAQIPEGIDLRAPVQVARFAPATLAVGDAFGYSVAIDGDTLVVGAPFHDRPRFPQGELRARGGRFG